MSPDSEAELLRRATALSGATVGEVAGRFGLGVPDLGRAKGFVGGLVERALGASAASRDVPDFEALGVELKTIPVGRDGVPRESTFVCTLPLATLGEETWTTSRVRRKLARVLWVPVERHDAVGDVDRRFGRPVLWSPSEDQERVLEEDWLTFAERVAGGHIERLTAHLGTYLQVRPKAATAAVRARATDADGAPFAHNPRGFYLRTALTRTIVGSPPTISR